MSSVLHDHISRLHTVGGFARAFQYCMDVPAGQVRLWSLPATSEGFHTGQIAWQVRESVCVVCAHLAEAGQSKVVLFDDSVSLVVIKTFCSND